MQTDIAGIVYENGTKEFDDFVTKHSVQTIPGSRSIIIVDIHQVGTSCGFSMPFFDFKAYRPTLNDFFEKKQQAELSGKTEESMDKYWAFKNAWSIDGLPGMERANTYGIKEKVAPIKKMIGPHAPQGFRQYSRPGQDWTVLILVAPISFVLGLIAMSLSPAQFHAVRPSQAVPKIFNKLNQSIAL